MKILLTFFGCYFLLQVGALAQTCPGNIDFEEGTLNGWQCTDGRIRLNLEPQGGPVTISNYNSAPIPGRHEIMTEQTLPAIDFFGKFPVLAPNGSRYSVKIGNTARGGLVTGVKYNIQIPPTDDKFYLEYQYAVVYENPSHQPEYQPRFEISVVDLTTQEQIDCSSISFVANLADPNFRLSNERHFGTSVLYRNWTPATLYLKNMAGKNVAISFTVTGCGYAEHFGYAYLDMNSICAERFSGASFCPGDTAIRVQGPAGYETYQWFSENYAQSLSATQHLIVQPAPPNNSIYNLVTKAFFKPNCIDTFQVKVSNDLVLQVNAGRDTSFCVGQYVRIGSPPQDGVIYRWSPGRGLSDSTIANPLANVTTQTRYTLTASSFGGGCTLTDDVLLSPYAVNTNLSLLGKDSVCISRADSAVLVANVSDTVTWFRDSIQLSVTTGNRYKVLVSGRYHAKITTPGGCSYFSDTISVYVEPAIANLRYPTLNLLNNIPYTLAARQIGVEYLWMPASNLNDPNIFNPVYTPGIAGTTYTVHITTAGGCVVTDTVSILLFPSVEIYVPSAFTPNGDGRNDYLRPILRAVEKLTYFKVFNRQGQEVFDIKQNPTGWDGRVKNLEQNTSAFIWIAEGIGVDKKVYKKKGSVLLLR